MADRRHCALGQLKSHAWQATLLGQPLYIGITLHADIASKPRLITLATQSEKRDRKKPRKVFEPSRRHLNPRYLSGIAKTGTSENRYYEK